LHTRIDPHPPEPSAVKEVGPLHYIKWRSLLNYVGWLVYMVYLCT
jgi:hypothetical protein